VFQSTVDFDPGSSADNHSALGTRDAFLSMFTQPFGKFVYLPLVRR
jgi:hypothetical protein